MSVHWAMQLLQRLTTVPLHSTIVTINMSSVEKIRKLVLLDSSFKIYAYLKKKSLDHRCFVLIDVFEICWCDGFTCMDDRPIFRDSARTGPKQLLIITNVYSQYIFLWSVIVKTTIYQIYLLEVPYTDTSNQALQWNIDISFCRL